MEKLYKIEKLDHQGRGIIRENGPIIFVENALPDEQVEIKIVKEKKQLKEAQVVAYYKQSSSRNKVKCPYYNQCGGCHIMHMSYKKQLEWKEEKVKEILNKFMDSSVLFSIQPIVASEEWNYRNKATFQVKQKLGYFAQKTNTIVPVEQCNLVDPNIQKLIPILSTLDISSCSQITIRASKNTNQTMVIFDMKTNIDTTKIVETLKEYVSSIYVKKEKLNCIYGMPFIEEKIGDCVFKISPGSFFQVNTNQAKKLYDIVLKYANVQTEDSVLDLYCGTGTIGIYISKYCHNVLGIEMNKHAVQDALENQKLNHIHNMEFICNDVSNIVDKIVDKYSVIIVDPPRSGLDQKTITYLKQSGAKRIVYVSCDPVTLARDLNQLKEKYHIKELTPVDMFPQTYHVECVCMLNRR